MPLHRHEVQRQVVEVIRLEIAKNIDNVRASQRFRVCVTAPDSGDWFELQGEGCTH